MKQSRAGAASSGPGVASCLGLAAASETQRGAQRRGGRSFPWQAAAGLQFGLLSQLTKSKTDPKAAILLHSLVGPPVSLVTAVGEEHGH